MIFIILLWLSAAFGESVFACDADALFFGITSAMLVCFLIKPMLPKTTKTNKVLQILAGLMIAPFLTAYVAMTGNYAIVAAIIAVLVVCEVSMSYLKNISNVI